MKIGVVGPGRWGCKLADAFRSCGGEVVFHVRRPGSDDAVGMGKKVEFTELLALANAGVVEAIVCAATPEVTKHVYECCRDLAVPALLTKPLVLDDIDRPPLVPIVVDYVRLWSPHYHKIKQDLRKTEVASVSVDFYGTGPFRSFPGLWDYGPHAVAFLFDILGDYEVDIKSVQKTERDGGDYRFVEGTIGLVPFQMAVGNASEEDVSKRLTVRTVGGGEYVYEEVGQTVRFKMPGKAVVDDTPRALQLMASDFMDSVVANRVSKGAVNLYTLWLTTKITRFLKEVEAAR